MSLGTFINEVRTTSGLTQQELAKLAGVGKTAVWELENDRGDTRFTTIQAVCRALNIRLQAQAPHHAAPTDLASPD